MAATPLRSKDNHAIDIIVDAVEMEVALFDLQDGIVAANMAAVKLAIASSVCVSINTSTTCVTTSLANSSGWTALVEARASSPTRFFQTDMEVQDTTSAVDAIEAGDITGNIKQALEDSGLATATGSNFSASISVSHVPSQGGFCADLYADWVAEGNEGLMSHKNISDFLKASNVSIFGTYVGTYNDDAASDMFYTASCDNHTFPGNATTNCPYYIQVANFSELAAKSEEIASFQRALALVETDVRVSDTTSKELSICSLDFLWGLLAFLPLLLYLLWRAISIFAAKGRLHAQLLAMVQKGKIDAKYTPAHDATVILLPHNHWGDIDYAISYAMFSCPCMLPATAVELGLKHQTTITL